jgi:hypothetical protein
MSKFKVGDKVKMIDTENTENEYGFVESMLQYGDTGIVEKTFGDIIWVSTGGCEYSGYKYSVDDFKLLNIEVNYIVTENSVTVSFDSKLITIQNDDRRYEAVIEAIKDDNLKAIPSLIDVVASFNKDNYELVDGIIKIDGVAISEELTNKVLAFKDAGLPTDYLLEFAKKIQENVSFNSRKMLYKFLEHNGHPITKNGNFIAYKMVRHNYRDLHTGKFDNSIGSTVEMNRSQVDENPNNPCSSGLHVATHCYAKGFGSGHLVEVEVDPRDVVAVPTDYNGTKMRVCKYVVKALCETILEEEIYEEDEYEEDEYCSEREW